jgi:sucrose-phosphate synthase
MNHAGRVIVSTSQERMVQYGHLAYKGAIDTEADKFAVVPPGVNLAIFDAQARGPEDKTIASYLEEMLARDIAPDRLGLPAVICSSRLDPKKNHLGLVRAFALDHDLRAAANLLIVVRGATDIHSREGFSESERAILDEIASISTAHDLMGKLSVFSLGSQMELAAAYRHLRARRSVFALTALYEPFGLAPLEAMAAGLPAVVTRSGGPSESLFDEATGQEFGVLVDPSDAADIAAGLLRLVGFAGSWDIYQQAGRERVLARYTWARTAAGYLKVIEEMLAARLAIPSYFLAPSLEAAPGLESLARVWPTAA